MRHLALVAALLSLGPLDSAAQGVDDATWFIQRGSPNNRQHGHVDGDYFQTCEGHRFAILPGDSLIPTSVLCLENHAVVDATPTPWTSLVRGTPELRYDSAATVTYLSLGESRLPVTDTAAARQLASLGLRFEARGADPGFQRFDDIPVSGELLAALGADGARATGRIVIGPDGLVRWAPTGVRLDLGADSPFQDWLAGQEGYAELLLDLEAGRVETGRSIAAELLAHRHGGDGSTPPRLPRHRPAAPGPPHHAPVLVDHLAAPDRHHRPPREGPPLEGGVVRVGGVVGGVHDVRPLRVQDHDVGDGARAEHAPVGVQAEGAGRGGGGHLHVALRGQAPLPHPLRPEHRAHEAEVAHPRAEPADVQRGLRSSSSTWRRPMSSDGSIFWARVQGAWSVASMSTRPSARPRHMASTSAAERRGGWPM